MARGTWRRWLGGGIAASLLLAAAPGSLAQTGERPTATTLAKPDAAKPATTAADTRKLPPKGAATVTSTRRVAAKKPAPAHPPTKITAAKPKAPEQKFTAAARRPARPKQIARTAAKVPAEPKVAAAGVKPVTASHRVGNTHDGVIVTATAPVSATSAARLAAVQVSLAEPAAAHPGQPIASASIVAPPAQAKAETPVVAAPASSLAPIEAAAQPADRKASVAFVANFLKNAFAIAKKSGATSLQRRAELADLFAGKMDMKRIAGYTTAEEFAAKAPDIQQRFRAILVSYLVETYYPQLELASDPSVRVEIAAAEPAADGTAVVWTTFTKDGWGSQSVQWRLAAESDGYKIVDIFSAGASLVQMERDTFQSVMRNGGFNELMAKLDARTKELASAATE